MTIQLKSHRGFLVTVCLVLVGCDASNRQSVRSKTSEDPTSWSGSPIRDRSESSSDESSSGPKGFLKATRLPGAMSSEGAEIERSLGVGR